jgi:hypothetical protein
MSEFMELCVHYDAIGRSLAALKEGKASLQMVLPGEDIEMDKYFPEINDKMERDLEVYWIDLRRQIRDRLQVDEAELQIDKVSRAMFGRENNASETN